MRIYKSPTSGEAHALNLAWRHDCGYYKLLRYFALFQCDRCMNVIANGRIIKEFDMDYPVIMRGDYCPECIEIVKQEHTRQCEICCKDMYVNNPNAKHVICEVCRRGNIHFERKRLYFQLARARKAGNPATLTLDQWLQTIKDFDMKCAYCGGSYDVLEHFIPMSRGGGTTVDNCLPACNSCNTMVSEERLKFKQQSRLREYLIARRPDELRDAHHKVYE